MFIHLKMRLVVILGYLLVTCGPLFVEAQKKIMIILPKMMRRAQNSTWNHFIRPPFTKSPKISEDGPSSPKLSSIQQHKKFMQRGKFVFFNQNFPHGGDDFDQGQEAVNHVVIPHGKRISHGIRIGHGYVPHEVLNEYSDFSKAPGPIEPAKNNPGNYYSRPYITEQTDNSLYQEKEQVHHHSDEERGQGRRTDAERIQYFSPNSHRAFSSTVLNKIQREPGFAPVSFVNPEKFSLSPKEGGLVLRDSVDLTDYRKQLMKFAKNWSAVMSVSPTSLPHISNMSPSAHHIPDDSFQPSNYPRVSPSFPHATQREGYAVKEDVVDIPQDYRSHHLKHPPPGDPRTRPPLFPQNIHY